MSARAEPTSGLWAGHYEQFGDEYPQRMTLEFADGLVRGDGVDDLGTFTLEGEYRAHLGEVRLGWIKTYDGAHSVLYLGSLHGGTILGDWRVQGGFTGGFALRLADTFESLSTRKPTR